MNHLPSYIDAFIDEVKKSLALMGISHIRERSFALTKTKIGDNVQVLFCCLEALETWKFYDYGKSERCPINEVEFENIISLTLNQGTWLQK